MGRRPELTSDEFFFWNPLDVEILRCENVFTVKKVLYLFGASVRELEPRLALIRVLALG